MKKRGVSFNERELAGKVRSLALEETFKVLSNPKSKLYGPVLIRLAGTILPRLNEVTGEGGAPLVIEISGAVAKKYAVNASSRTNS